MILWTIQPEEVYELIQRTGVYHCDYGKSGMGLVYVGRGQKEA